MTKRQIAAKFSNYWIIFFIRVYLIGNIVFQRDENRDKKIGKVFERLSLFKLIGFAILHSILVTLNYWFYETPTNQGKLKQKVNND